MLINRHILKKTSAYLRQFHVSSRLNIDPKTVEEIRIPVPWGYIAGKWWGSKDIQPILAIHGWLDNCGSWDPLIERLPSNLSVLAIDVPGNGLSSHLPQFQSYNPIYSGASLVHRIKNYYNFDKLSLLGHSGGSSFCFIYSSFFPENVYSIFGIDYLLYAYKDDLRRVEKIGKLIDDKILLALKDPKNSMVHKEDELATAWVKGTKGSVNDKSIKILMRRGTSRVGNSKVTLTRDIRLKLEDTVAIGLPEAYEMIANINCDVCLIKATQSKLFDSGIRHCVDILDVLKKNAKSFQFHEVDGHHHVHMDTPEKIASLYVDFIEFIKK